MPNRGHDAPQLPRIRRAPIRALNIYEVSDAQLESLERGSPDSVFLNFAVFLLSLALSFTVTIITTTIGSVLALVFFCVIIVVGYAGGVLLLIVWLWTHKSSKHVIQEIRRRLPPDGEQLQYND